MPKSDQGFHQKRFTVIPRTLIFVTRGDKVLLLQGAPDKKLWANKYNGIGGHVEGGESIYRSAQRELFEETGIESDNLAFCGTILVDSGEEKGICIFIFKTEYEGTSIVDSNEGKLHWVSAADFDTLSLVEDLPAVLPKVLAMVKGDSPFFARSFYSDDGRLMVSFD